MKTIFAGHFKKLYSETEFTKFNHAHSMWEHLRIAVKCIFAYLSGKSISFKMLARYNTKPEWKFQSLHTETKQNLLENIENETCVLGMVVFMHILTLKDASIEHYRNALYDELFVKD